MAGVILENLSRRSLIIFLVVLVVFQIAFFLIGGLIAPNPSYVHQLLAMKCQDKKTGSNHLHLHKSRWFIPRGSNHVKCNIVDLSSPEATDPNEIVFAMMFPLPRDNQELKMDPLFQNLVATLMMDIVYDKDNYIDAEDPRLKLDVRLGYRNEDEAEDTWHELAHSEEERNLDCSIDPTQQEDGNHYNCKLLPLFELGSVFHDFYLLNIRLPVKHHRYNKALPNVGIGKVEDLWVFAIHQNGGFTLVWFIMKTCLFPVILIALIWFWRRVVKLDRKSNLLEKSVFALGLAMSFLNLPVDWLTLAFDTPYFLFFQDLRQGIFYSILLSFWILFLGEHSMDQVERKRIVQYWKHLSAVAFGCICLFVFEICQRGVQLSNPFFSIWATKSSSKVGLAFVILAGISAGIYFLFLCYMLIRVLWNIRTKKTTLSHMSSVRRRFYTGLIHRFYFMLAVTLVCAALTVIFFIIGQLSEGSWKWGDEDLQPALEYTSAFLTGVYGMWNIYVFSLLVLYAPSLKVIQTNTDTNDETVHFNQSQMASETMALADFAKKTAAD